MQAIIATLGGNLSFPVVLSFTSFIFSLFKGGDREIFPPPIVLKHSGMTRKKRVIGMSPYSSGAQSF